MTINFQMLDKTKTGITTHYGNQPFFTTGFAVATAVVVAPVSAKCLMLNPPVLSLESM
jgi:hypothetical protein